MRTRMGRLAALAIAAGGGLVVFSQTPGSPQTAPPADPGAAQPLTDGQAVQGLGCVRLGSLGRLRGAPVPGVAAESSIGALLQADVVTQLIGLGEQVRGRRG